MAITELANRNSVKSVNVGVKLVHSTSFTDSHNKNSSESVIAKIILSSDWNPASLNWVQGRPRASLGWVQLEKVYVKFKLNLNDQIAGLENRVKFLLV